MVHRFSNNPLFTPSDLKPSRSNLEIIGVFNPAATLFEGKRLLMLRVAERAIPETGHVATPILDPKTGEVCIRQFRLNDPLLQMEDPRFFTYNGELFLTSLSHFRIAASEDGVNFTIDPHRTMLPHGSYEAFGIEDARITQLEGTFYINYTAVSSDGVVTALASTTDFKNFQRLGVIFGPDNKDVALFPEKINGRYHAFHRPAVKHAGLPSIWTASSDNLLDWGRHEIVISPRRGSWDCERVGASTSPVKTPEGWLSIYHAADHNTRYCLGALLLDLEKPWIVHARSQEPFFVPEAPYEKEGFMQNVIFHNGTIDTGDGFLELYYGGADLVSCRSKVQIADLLAHLGK